MMAERCSKDGVAVASGKAEAAAPWHRLYFRPLPQKQGSLRFKSNTGRRVRPGQDRYASRTELQPPGDGYDPRTAPDPLESFNKRWHLTCRR